MSKLKNFLECTLDDGNGLQCGGTINHEITPAFWSTLTIIHKCTECNASWETIIEPSEAIEVEDGC